MKSIKIFFIIFFITNFIYCNQSKKINIPQIYIDKGIECLELRLSNPLLDNRDLEYEINKKLKSRIVITRSISNMYILIEDKIIIDKEESEKIVWHLKYSDNLYYVHKLYGWENDDRLKNDVKKKLEDKNLYILANVMITSNREIRQKYFEKIDLKESERWKKKIFLAIRIFFKEHPKLYNDFDNELELLIDVGDPIYTSADKYEFVLTPGGLTYIKIKDKKNVEYWIVIEGSDKSTGKEIEELKVGGFSKEKVYIFPKDESLLNFKSYKMKLKEE